MRATSINTCRKISNSGFSLVEIIVVIAIMSVLIAIGVPNYVGYKEKAKEEICRTNCLQIERMYESYLILEEIGHSNNIFTQFIQRYDQSICPDRVEISYEYGKAKCSVHNSEDNSKDEEESDDVPYL